LRQPPYKKEDFYMSDARYPIGCFSPDDQPTPETRTKHIDDIASLPLRLRHAVSGLTPEQVNTAYREGGWTAKQVINHLPDSHINGYVRFKLALTENVPTITPYDEGAWASLIDTESTSIEVSLALLEAIHIRWVNLLRSLKEEDFERKFNHPQNGAQTLDRALAMYGWHSRHHVAHITSLRERMKW
jgi:hypothetical protein